MTNDATIQWLRRSATEIPRALSTFSEQVRVAAGPLNCAAPRAALRVLGAGRHGVLRALRAGPGADLSVLCAAPDADPPSCTPRPTPISVLPAGAGAIGGVVPGVGAVAGGVAAWASASDTVNNVGVAAKLKRAASPSERALQREIASHSLMVKLPRLGELLLRIPT